MLLSFLLFIFVLSENEKEIMGQSTLCVLHINILIAQPSPWCLGSYRFIIKDFGQTAVVAIIT